MKILLIIPPGIILLAIIAKYVEHWRWDFLLCWFQTSVEPELGGLENRGKAKYSLQKWQLVLWYFEISIKIYKIFLTNKIYFQIHPAGHQCAHPLYLALHLVRHSPYFRTFLGNSSWSLLWVLEHNELHSLQDYSRVSAMALVEREGISMKIREAIQHQSCSFF